jgi:hypothetical protein
VRLSALLFPKKWLLVAGNNGTPPSCYLWECGRTARLWRARGPTKTPSLIFAALILANFLARYLNAGAAWSIALIKVVISPSLMCRGDSKGLLESGSYRCCTFPPPPLPVLFGKSSSYSCNGKSLLECSIHTRNSKISCSPAAVQTM